MFDEELWLNGFSILMCALHQTPFHLLNSPLRIFSFFRMFTYDIRSHTMSVECSVLAVILEWHQSFALWTFWRIFSWILSSFDVTKVTISTKLDPLSMNWNDDIYVQDVSFAKSIIFIFSSLVWRRDKWKTCYDLSTMNIWNKLH